MDMKRWYRSGETGLIRRLPLGVSFLVAASFGVIFVLLRPFVSPIIHAVNDGQATWLEFLFLAPYGALMFLAFLISLACTKSLVDWLCDGEE